MPTPVAALYKDRTVFYRSKTGITGLNPARDMDVYPLLSVL